MKSVRIGPHRYKLEIVSKVGEDDNWGQYYSDEQKIELSDKLSGSKWAEILVHEMVHGIVDNWGIDLPDEEKFVSVFSIGLTQVLKDNPTLFRSILKALK